MPHRLAEISLDRIDQDALKVVRRLQRYGHQAYLVGGCVRDLLLEQTPKDFDVSTSATPSQIKKLFRNCRIIGRRFRLAHLFFGRKIIETSTFRAPPEVDPGATGEEMIIWRDNKFGTAEEDARRRDFTINGLFYDPVAERVIDSVGGLDDLRALSIRTIGDPQVRMQEDPVRILRAIKFATRLQLQIEPQTLRAMVEFRGLIASCAVARVLEEIYKLLGGGHSAAAFRLMHSTGVLSVLLPEVTAVLEPPQDAEAARPLQPIDGLKPTRRSGQADDSGDHTAQDEADLKAHQRSIRGLIDQLLGQDPAHLERARQWFWPHLEQLDSTGDGTPDPSHAYMLSTVLMGLCSRALSEEVNAREAYELLEQAVTAVAGRLAVSRKDRQHARQLLFAQLRLQLRSKRARPRAMMNRDYFREALALLEMSSRATGTQDAIVQRWRRLQEEEPVTARERPRPRRRRRRRRRPEPPRQ